jgi:hypothetical protein
MAVPDAAPNVQKAVAGGHIERIEPPGKRARLAVVQPAGRIDRDKDGNSSVAKSGNVAKLAYL